MTYPIGGAFLAASAVVCALGAGTAAVCGVVWGRFAPRALVIGHMLVWGSLLGAAVVGGRTVAADWGWCGPMRETPAGKHGAPGGCVYAWHSPDYAVRYHFDRDGWRRTPEPTHPAGQVLCLGCSFTFGAGVADDEAYPALLGARYWPAYWLRNCGISGAGVGEGWLVLRQALDEGAPPVAVLYGWMADQRGRNYRRRSLHQRFLGETFRLFEIENGRLTYRGPLPHAAADLPDSPETLATEERVCRALFDELRGLCQQRGIPFYVVALSEATARPTPDRVIEALEEAGFSVIDARGVDGPFFPHDKHPMAAWHARVAALVAEQVPVGE